MDAYNLVKERTSGINEEDKLKVSNYLETLIFVQYESHRKATKAAMLCNFPIEQKIF